MGASAKGNLRVRRGRRGRRAADVSVEGLLTPAPCFLHGIDEHRRARGGPGVDTRHAGRCQEAPLPPSPTRAAYAEVGGVLFVLLYTVRNLVFRFYFRLKKIHFSSYSRMRDG